MILLTTVKYENIKVYTFKEFFGKYKSFSDYYNLQEYKDNIRMLRDRMGSVYTGIFEFGKEDAHFLSFSIWRCISAARS